MNKEEAARLRSYLASQSRRRTPAQLIEALQETRDRLVQALAAIPDTAFFTPIHQEKWSAATILEHVCEATALYERDICAVIERGESPENVGPMDEPIMESTKREDLLSKLKESCEHLSTSVLQTGPDDHLDITWYHFELGQMHWREWLLFARVHLLDHLSQVQAIAAGIASQDR